MDCSVHLPSGRWAWLGLHTPVGCWRCLGCASPRRAARSPNDPSPLPEGLSLSCPTSFALEAHAARRRRQSRSIRLWHATAVRRTQIECSPAAAGTVFPVGQTRVDCTATDADQTRKACSFNVDVRVSQTLEKTRYLSFGDSITAGTVSPAPVLLDNPDSYPFKLERMLRESYRAQDIAVLNYGIGGERLQQGAARLPSVLAAEKPQVLLLLQGIISVREIPTATNARHLRTMITDARQRGIDVVIATVMPVGAGLEARQPGINAAVVALNVEIGRLAQEFGLGAPVDLYGLFRAEPRLIGRDDLHPTEEGFYSNCGDIQECGSVPLPQAFTVKSASARRLVWAVLILLPLVLLLTGRGIDAGVGLSGRYYPGTDWQGDAILRIDREISTRSLNPLPESLPGSFSARWDGYLHVDRPGRYVFQLISDDGAWLEIDGRGIIDNGGNHSPILKEATVDLAEGDHVIGLTFFQDAGGWRLDLCGRPRARCPRGRRALAARNACRRLEVQNRSDHDRQSSIRSIPLGCRTVRARLSSGAYRPQTPAIDGALG